MNKERPRRFPWKWLAIGLATWAVALAVRLLVPGWKPGGGIVAQAGAWTCFGSFGVFLLGVIFGLAVNAFGRASRVRLVLYAISSGLLWAALGVAFIAVGLRLYDFTLDFLGVGTWMMLIGVFLLFWGIWAVPGMIADDRLKIRIRVESEGPHAIGGGIPVELTLESFVPTRVTEVELTLKRVDGVIDDGVVSAGELARMAGGTVRPSYETTAAYDGGWVLPGKPVKQRVTFRVPVEAAPPPGTPAAWTLFARAVIPKWPDSRSNMAVKLVSPSENH